MENKTSEIKAETSKHLEPGIFWGKVEDDSDRWIKKFEIYYKNKGWTEKDFVGIAEVHFEGQAKAWFEVYNSKLTSWEVLKTNFKEKFSIDAEETRNMVEERSNNIIEGKNVEKVKIVKYTLPEPSRDSGMYEALINRFDKLSLNIIDFKQDINSAKNTTKYRNAYLCSICKKRGHDEKYCRWRDGNVKNCNTVEVEDNAEELLAVKRDLVEPYNEKNKYSKISEEIINEDPPTQARVRTRKPQLNIKFIEEKAPYSIKDDLGDRKVDITFAQLLKSSADARSELFGLCKPEKLKPMMNLSTENQKISNCRAVVRINGNTYRKIMDMGAACSVISEDLALKLRVYIEKDDTQIIISADGKRNKTVGKIKRLQRTIAGHKFPASVLVIPNAEQEIILGVDWLLAHKAILNLEEKELILPKGEVDVILSLSTNNKITRDEVECYGIGKLKDKIEPQNEFLLTKNLLKEYNEMLVDEIEDLGATKAVKNEIETGEARPIRVRPYKLPHALQDKAISELKGMVQRGIIRS
ncbi:hypothetical protein AYI69_g752 [Smittium culicis]|uniref:DNA damage-inducible protein 1 n=1 Tax=Smittium culicis TaxID=133412 RepID=A0A1R1YS54_9FUNG|nr:hypothetical protein AYI69_g752 [Smittium culicis]